MSQLAEQSRSLETALADFLRALHGKNRSIATIRAYRTDVLQFIIWLHENNLVISNPKQVDKMDITEYLATLAARKVSGTSRARKVAAIREYFRYCEEHGLITRSPATTIEVPKREQKARTYLQPSEYTKMLSLAGSNVRDYAILQVFLQTGVRVSELCNLRLDDVNFEGRALLVRAGKGGGAREIELEKKVLHALKNYLAARPRILDDHLFLNRDGEPLGERGVRKLVVKYVNAAQITKKASCHSLRHTFATYKAQRGVSSFRLKEWLGHRNLNTTEIYVHLGKVNAHKEMETTSL